MATLAAGFARFLGFLFPAVGTPLFTLHLFGGEFAGDDGATTRSARRDSGNGGQLLEREG